MREAATNELLLPLSSIDRLQFISITSDLVICSLDSCVSFRVRAVERRSGGELVALVAAVREPSPARESALTRSAARQPNARVAAHALPPAGRQAPSPGSLWRRQVRRRLSIGVGGPKNELANDPHPELALSHRGDQRRA